MACSKIFARCALFSSGRGSHTNQYNRNKQNVLWQSNNQSLHTSNMKPKSLYNTTAKFFRKVRDTILVLEASKGPVTKMAMGLCQTGATAALVFSSGYALTFLTNGLETENDQKAMELHQLLADINLEEDAHHILDSDSIRSFIEEKRRMIDQRINLTYFHMASSLITAGITSILSFRVFKNKALLIKIGNRPVVAVAVGVITPFVMGSLVRSLPRTPSSEGKLIPFGIKELGHLLYAGSLGLVAAPLYLLGGQSMIRALYVTAGCVTGLHGLSQVIPKTSLLNYEIPILIAINSVLVSFLLTLLIRPSHYAFMPLYRYMMHGGLVVYSISYLHALQRIGQSVRSRLYDPVNGAMSLSMNTLNIFGRLAFLLPPHFQMSRDHLLVIPLKHSSTTSSKNTNNQHKNIHKPDGNSGDGGNGSGHEM